MKNKQIRKFHFQRKILDQAMSGKEIAYFSRFFPHFEPMALSLMHDLSNKYNI